MSGPSLPAPALDHLVYATPNLHSTVRDLSDQLGVTPSPGGRHVGRGTRNYLLGLAEGSYLEVIGPDRDQDDFTGTRPFGMNTLERPRLLAWAVRVTDIDAYVRRAQASGYDPGPVRDMSRVTPDGERLSWRLTETEDTGRPALIPFLIDWGSTRHPSEASPIGATLVGFRCETSDPRSLLTNLEALGVTAQVDLRAGDRLVCEVEGQAGVITLS